MPAIDLTRLRTKIALLKALYDFPTEFIQDLRELFRSYAGTPSSSIANLRTIAPSAAFNSPALLSREIELAFSKHPVESPHQTLQVVDVLWKQPENELRRLAIYLLSRMAVDHNEAIVERTLLWSQAPDSSSLTPYLLQQACKAVRRENPQDWLTLLNGWKTEADPTKKHMTLRGLIPLIQDADYDNLPELFTYLISFFAEFDVQLQNDLRSVLLALSARSEVETLYFLKQMIALYPTPALGRFLRQSLEQFPERTQSSLREAMREQTDLK